MKEEHIRYLVCPDTRRPLRLATAEAVVDGRIRTGVLVEPVSGTTYPIRDFIARFVPEDNYANSFGLEWTIHGKTQYDGESGFDVSARRFRQETKWEADLAGELVLEVGSGSGRFTTQALDTGAMVCSLDYSKAVEANYQSNGHRDNLLLVQASVYAMPFVGGFDKAFCFGVLQHTPDPRAAFLAMVDQVRPGGSVSCDIYELRLATLLTTKYWVRPFTRRMPPDKLYRRVTAYVDFMWPLARRLRRIPGIGKSLNWALLVADYSRLLPGADDATLKQWAYLDTFDMLSPAHDHPETLGGFRRWFREAGLTDIEAHYGYNGIEGRGRKPVSGGVS
jgi:SAM-dependent methyltransferase